MSSNRQIATARPSASLIVIDSQNRVLMVERNPNSKSFAGAYVFPGGNFDAKQDTSSRLTAIRETFEESGILLATLDASASPLSQEVLDDARKSIHAQRLSFRSFLEQNGLTPVVDELLPFTQWITPTHMPRRFHTYFYVTFLSSTASASGQGLQRLPTPDGGIEVISVRFVKPQDAISEFRADKISLMPPQFYLLSTLSMILVEDATTSEERKILSQLARGPFGGLAINPRALPEKTDEGLLILTYEGDESRGGKLGARHRVHVRSGKGGMSVVKLERNFDIFTEVPSQLETKTNTKL